MHGALAESSLGFNGRGLKWAEAATSQLDIAWTVLAESV